MCQSIRGKEASLLTNYHPPPKKKNKQTNKQTNKQNDKLGTCFVLSFIESDSKEK